jgi:formate/nitrite transporter FocA (FNT family)
MKILKILKRFWRNWGVMIIAAIIGGIVLGLMVHFTPEAPVRCCRLC